MAKDKMQSADCKKKNAPEGVEERLEEIVRANFSDEDLVSRFRKGNESIAESLKAERVRNAEARGSVEDVIKGERHVGKFLFSEEGERREGGELSED